MYRISQSPVWQVAVLDALLAALNARPAGALFTTPKLDLYVNNYAPTGNDAFSAFTLATFHGYAEVTPVFNAPGNLQGNDQAVTSSGFFQATAGGITVATCYGYLLSDGAANVYFAEQFAVPVGFANPGDFLDLDLVLPLKLFPTFNV